MEFVQPGKEKVKQGKPLRLTNVSGLPVVFCGERKVEGIIDLNVEFDSFRRTKLTITAYAEDMQNPSGASFLDQSVIEDEPVFKCPHCKKVLDTVLEE